MILLENVQEFRSWGPLLKSGPKRGRPDPTKKGHTFIAWVARLERLGYRVEWKVLDASHYGAPTRRLRVFVVARCDGQPVRWPTPTHGKGLLPLRTAAECIDWSLPCPSIFERKKPLADKTLWRIAEGIRRYVIEAPRPFIVDIAHGQSTPGGARRWGSGAHSIDDPLSTVLASSGGGGRGLVAPVLINTRNGEREGQRPRALDIEAPAPTVTAKGSQGALVAAFLDRHFGDRGRGESYALPFDGPTGTITSRDHHALTAATLLRFNHDDNGVPLDQPMPAVTAKGLHVAEVRAFLTAFYGSGTPGQSLYEPTRVITAKHRLGLVTVEGTEYQIVDIGMRMLEPHELLRAQFGDFASTYDLSAATTKADKVRLIGNSVCPNVAEALARANCGELAQVEADGYCR